MIWLQKYGAEKRIGRPEDQLQAHSKKKFDRILETLK